MWDKSLSCQTLPENPRKLGFRGSLELWTVNRER